MPHEPIRLRGMTWDHPRGHDPLVACSAVWRRQTGVDVTWDRRSLADFEAYPLDDLARRYDLIVIDHPHVGQAAAAGCLVAFPPQQVGDVAMVGPSTESYRWEGQLFARPIDAACQVSAAVAGQFNVLPGSWTDIAALAREGRVAWPLKAPHAFLSFCTLAANRGIALGNAGDREFIDPVGAQQVLDLMCGIVAWLPRDCRTSDPIDALERMGAAETRSLYAPLVFGYVSYAVAGFRTRRLLFSDIVAVAGRGPAGSVLGGTGIAVSAHGRVAEALLFAEWLASAPAQSLAGRSGGQPASRAAWDDRELNDATAGFYSRTRRTIEACWTRPRHRGFLEFQRAASVIVEAALYGEIPVRTATTRLNAAFAASTFAQPSYQVAPLQRSM